MKMSSVFLIAITSALIFSGAAYAETQPNALMTGVIEGLSNDASAADPGFTGFSARAGEELFLSTRLHSKKGKQRGCTTCHTDDPSAKGRTQVGKSIEPISPATNPDRFTDPKKVGKWFKRNCKWVLERECTPVEKGNFLTYMLSL